jgi:hypothetical protein
MMRKLYQDDDIKKDEAKRVEVSVGASRLERRMPDRGLRKARCSLSQQRPGLRDLA